MSLLKLIEEAPTNIAHYPAWALVGRDRFKDPVSGEWFIVHEFIRTSDTMELRTADKKVFVFPRNQQLAVERW